jgi:hypothetical protein
MVDKNGGKVGIVTLAITVDHPVPILLRGLKSQENKYIDQ